MPCGMKQKQKVCKVDNISPQTKDEFIQDIKNAFRNVTRPDIDEIFIDSADHIFDAKLAAKRLSLVSFENLDISILNRNRDRISYFTSEGFLAYMPAFLITIISRPHEVDVMRDNLLFYLMPKDKEQFQISFETRISLFDVCQIKVIIRFFENHEIFFPRSKWSFTVLDEIEIYQASKYWRTMLEKKSQS